MAESNQNGLDTIGGVEDKIATEDLLAVYQAFPHFVKATELGELVHEYQTQTIELTERIEKLQICPILRLKRWRLNFLIEATLHDARGEHMIGNSLLPPGKPFA